MPRPAKKSGATTRPTPVSKGGGRRRRTTPRKRRGRTRTVPTPTTSKRTQRPAARPSSPPGPGPALYVSRTRARGNVRRENDEGGAAGSCDLQARHPTRPPAGPPTRIDRSRAGPARIARSTSRSCTPRVSDGCPTKYGAGTPRRRLGSRLGRERACTRTRKRLLVGGGSSAKRTPRRCRRDPVHEQDPGFLVPKTSTARIGRLRHARTRRGMIAFGRSGYHDESFQGPTLTTSAQNHSAVPSLDHPGGPDR